MDHLLAQIGWAVYDFLGHNANLTDTVLELDGFEQPALDAARCGDDRAERLLGEITCLVAEYTAGHRSLDALRDGLRAACRAVPRGTATFSTAASQSVSLVFG